MSDLISREELKKTIKRIESFPWGDEEGNRVEFQWSPKELEYLIDKAPSAKPPPETCWGCNCPKMEETKKGRWNVEHGVFMHDDIYGDIYRCSVCGYRERNPEGFIYCPNCGAKMEDNKK